MSKFRSLRLVAAATLLSASAVAASAQTSPQAPASPPAEKPPMAKPESQTSPAPAPQAQAPSKPSTTQPAHPLIGRTVLSSDGNRAGDVRAVKTAPDGKVTAIQLKVGGFLGFGGRIVEVAEGKFTQKGDTIQIGYTSEEMSKLPEVRDAS